MKKDTSIRRPISAINLLVTFGGTCPRSQASTCLQRLKGYLKSITSVQMRVFKDAMLRSADIFMNN